MNHKVLGSVFVLAITLGVTSVAVRPSTPPPPVKSAERKTELANMLRGFNATPRSMQAALTSKTDVSRALSSYGVRELGILNGMEFKTMAYQSRVSEEGFRYGNKEFTIELGIPRLAQKGAALESRKADFAHPAQAVGEVNRGDFVEKYVFENKRVEQIFTVPQRVGEGAMEIRIPVTSPIPGEVVAHGQNPGGFQSTQFQNGGLDFKDAAGTTKLAVHSAIAMDSAGLRMALTPRFENREIVLPVPAAFMDRAVYPVIVDPWFDLAGSGSGGGITNNSSVSDRPAMVMSGSGLPWVAWADNSASSDPNNTDIYVAAWTGFQWINYAGGLNPGGISANAGRSTNPSICIGRTDGFPVVAWQDDTEGYVEIYVKKAGGAGGGWNELAGSGSAGGISRFVGPMQHPSVSTLTAVVPGVGTVSSDTIEAPIVAYEDATSASNINVMVFYPGQSTVPPTPAGWYQLTGAGRDTSVKFVNASGFVDEPNVSNLGVSEFPCLDIDALGNPVVAWQETMDGNYEIYVKTYNWNSGGFFQIRPGASAGFFDITPVGSWVGISGSANPGGISGTASASQHPVLAIDTIGGTNNISVAWQETLPAVPATTSQIYLKRSVNGGAFAQVLGSATGNGISQSTGLATAPAIATGGNYLAVAWSDDSSGNPEIYARRISLAPLSAQWEQIGFQGSAAPLLGTDLFAPTDGLSKTPATYSLQPVVQVDNFGNPTVAWMDGINAHYDILLKQFAPNGPGIASGTNFILSVRQTDGDPLTTGTDIAVGGTITVNNLFLSARMFTEDLLPLGTSLSIEVEVQPFSVNFTGTPTQTGLAVVPDTTTATPANICVAHVTGLANFNYHWQIRTVDQMGRRSPWFPFGSIGNTSFRIDTTATGGGGGGGGGGGTTPPPLVNPNSSSKGKCGLLGLEALAALGLIRLLRRRK